MNFEELSNPSMDKKKRLKHKVNKAKEQSTMEKSMKQQKQKKSINEILPVELIQRILLRLPVKHLGRLTCVSKLWRSLISDPDFVESHLHLSLAPTHACLYQKDSTEASLVHLEVLNGDNYRVKEVSFPFKKKPPSKFRVMGSCRGFVLLSRQPHFFVVWNPLTGFSKRISSSCMVHRSKRRCFKFPRDASLYGFGYDASRDDYLVVVAWQDGDCQYLDCFPLKTNSWINLDAALLNPLGSYNRHSHGLFFNGTIHWVATVLKAHRDAILIFDLKEMTFSMISAPEQVVTSSYSYSGLALLGGCLALYYLNSDSRNTHIWVMKEYKVQLSWTLYQIPCKDFRPLCLSSNRDIIGRRYLVTGYFVYNVRGDLLKHFKNLCCPLPFGATDTVYTESLLPLPSHIKDKDN